jgi:PAS domain S-box-containing protein
MAQECVEARTGANPEGSAIASMAGSSAKGSAQENSIRVLVLEDRPEDAELLVRELRRSWLNPEWQRADSEASYLQQLQARPDVILSGYRMPHLDATRALRLLRDLDLDIPFIVVSGAIGEDAAVAIMRDGASDYLLKDRLARLGAAVKRSLEQKRLRAETSRAEQALRAAEIRFYSFMNHNPALAFIKDESGRMLYMNNTCERVWDRTFAECEGKLDHEIWPPDIAEPLRANDVAVLEGQASEFIDEVRLKNGRELHLLSFRFPFDDTGGRRLVGGVAVDISEHLRTQRQLAAALAVKEALLREVHHRVKNNLQIISSLLSMQAESLRGSTAAQALLDGQRRVQCMAMIHNRLKSDRDIERLDFREFAESLISDLFYSHGVSSDRIQLRFELEPVTLDLNQAIPCGLALNELVTNALKYAFPNDRTGELRVTLRCDAENRVKLTVADDGVGLSPGFDWRESPSLGLRIVDVLRRQLGGMLEHESRPGTTFRLLFTRTESRHLRLGEAATAIKCTEVEA